MSMPLTYTQVLCFKVTQEMHDEVKAQASAIGMPYTKMYRELIKLGLDETEEE